VSHERETDFIEHIKQVLRTETAKMKGLACTDHQVVQRLVARNAPHLQDYSDNGNKLVREFVERIVRAAYAGETSPPQPEEAMRKHFSEHPEEMLGWKHFWGGIQTPVVKIYLDNVIVSGMSRGDLKPPTEMDAVRQIEAADQRGESGIVTSSETRREQDRTRDLTVRAQFEQDREKVPLVPLDHVLLITRAVYDNQGNWCGNAPMLTEVVDKELFDALKSAGLEDADARHLMFAVHNGCDRFVTLDPHFLDRRVPLQALGRGILIQRPSELVAELSPPVESTAAT